MEEHISETIERIHERNVRVEADKAWETSLVRVLIIAAITYVSASLFLYMIGVSDWYLSAFVPVGGYVLSTQSLPAIKNGGSSAILKSEDRWKLMHT